jgi:hypothetical protein
VAMPVHASVTVVTPMLSDERNSLPKVSGW